MKRKLPFVDFFFFNSNTPKTVEERKREKVRIRNGEEEGKGEKKDNFLSQQPVNTLM